MSVEDLPAKKSSGTDYTDWRTQRHPPISSSRLSELDQGFPTVGEDYSYTEIQNWNCKETTHNVKG